VAAPTGGVRGVSLVRFTFVGARKHVRLILGNSGFGRHLAPAREPGTTGFGGNQSGLNDVFGREASVRSERERRLRVDSCHLRREKEA
jgi:hypothetical protein